MRVLKRRNYYLALIRKAGLVNTLKNDINNKIRRRAHLKSIVITSLDENIIHKDDEGLDIELMYSDLVSSEDYKLLKKIVLDKYSVLEVAQEIGISAEACKKRVQRAKKRLKERLLKMG